MTSTASHSDVIRLFTAETLVDPWGTYGYLRDNEPVFHDADQNLHVVTRYDLVMQALRDPATFSSEYGAFMIDARIKYMQLAPPQVRNELMRIADKMLPRVNTMLTADPPVHTRYRSLVDRLFTAGAVRRMEPHVDAVIRDAAAGFVNSRGETEFIHGFAFPVPLRVIADRLGVPPEDRDFFYDGATAAAGALRLTMPGDDEAIRRAWLVLDIQNYMVDLVERRRAAPRDDLCSVLGQVELEDEKRRLDAGELWSILSQFLIAGHETTTSTFGWGMLLLCRHPELQDRLRGDARLIRTFVEEVLRLEAPVQGLPRVVTRDTELGGYKLRKGDVLMLRFGAANRDERQFACPNQVEVDRRNAGSQLAFSSGIHYCVGAPLARQELNLGFAALLERMENIRLAPGHGEPKAEASLILRNLPELWIEFDRRAA